ncbi:MAG TPA: thiamine phosphate synthase [Vicinamibacteria bacterium]|nr:thiamine phosphate synthase [Vicinamibacteria bacterium]
MMSFRRRLCTCMITADVDETSLVRQVELALAAGVDFVQLRRRNRPAREVEALAKRLVALSPRARKRVLVNGRLDVALSSGAAGVHLPADGLPVAAVRRVAPPGFVVSRSTHSREAVERAFDDGASFVVFGPIFPTASKPGHPGVGLEALEEVVSSVPIPVYALGGVTPERVSQIAETGVHGIAGISVFEREDGLRDLFARLERIRKP